MNEQVMKRFKARIRKLKYMEEALGVLHWDMRTTAPRKGLASRTEVVGMLSGEWYRLATDNELGEMLELLGTEQSMAEMNEIDRRLVQVTKQEFERKRKIPQERYEAYTVLTSNAETKWEEAKERSDFASFQPFLEQIIAYQQEFAQLWGYEGHLYNALLEDYEPGMTVEELDRVFILLKEKVVPLLQEIQHSDYRPNSQILKQKVPPELQQAFSEFILREMGYDFEAGRLDKSAHPFATGLNPGDVRITTNFIENDLTFSFFSSIHEGGHALYEQNIDPKLNHTTLCTGTSMGIHESQSRLWENIIGRSLPFWKRYYPELQSRFPQAFGQIQLTDFYEAINEVKPSLIRIEADELTYNLHIIIRYELEKSLIGGDLAVADLPQAWSQKYRDYLGIEPTNHREGVLQDVHWSAGLFGYFPSYALGNMYAAQIMHEMESKVPQIQDHLAHGRLSPIKEWLTDNVYQYGKLRTPNELILSISGEKLNPSYFVQYLNTKYREIYKL